MTTLIGVRKLLFAAPLLAVVSAWALPPVQVEATVPATEAALVQVSEEAPADVTSEEATEVITDGSDAMFVSNCTYYNNANHTQVVGQFGYDCCNNPVAWGRKTAYSVCGGCFPCIPPPR